MKLKDVFEEISVGYNVTNAAVKDKYSKIYKILHKESIQYTNVIDSRLSEKAITGKVKKKHLIHQGDLLIFVKKPYRVGTYKYNPDEEIIIPNNFIVLRGINEDLYSNTFVANYLEKIGIENYVKDNEITGNLILSQVEDIDLPDISKEKQMTISILLNAINDRSAMYTNILDNDDTIIKYAIESITGDKND